jgi:hypothetical protein
MDSLEKSRDRLRDAYLNYKELQERVVIDMKEVK